MCRLEFTLAESTYEECVQTKNEYLIIFVCMCHNLQLDINVKSPSLIQHFLCITHAHAHSCMLIHVEKHNQLEFGTTIRNLREKLDLLSHVCFLLKKRKEKTNQAHHVDIHKLLFVSLFRDNLNFGLIIHPNRGRPYLFNLSLLTWML